MCKHLVVCKSVHHLEGQNRETYLLKLKLQMVMSCHYKCWELNLGSLKEQPVFLLLSHLSSPYIYCLKVAYNQHAK